MARVRCPVIVATVSDVLEFDPAGGGREPQQHHEPSQDIPQQDRLHRVMLQNAAVRHRKCGSE